MLYTENTKQDLKGVIAIYNNALSFLPYENGTLQPERMPLKKDLAKLVSLINSDEEYTHFAFNGIIPNHVLHFQNHAKNVVWTTEKTVKKLMFHERLPLDNAN